MPEHERTRATKQGDTPVPSLIERYQLRHQSWLAQADELARLRDEVRAAAEREALEIVATARRDIREVIAEARRELLVLTAQLQATLGTSEGAVREIPGGELPRLDALGVSRTSGPGEPTRSIQAALDEAKAGIDALAMEADDVQFPLETPEPAQPAPAQEPLRVGQWTVARALAPKNPSLPASIVQSVPVPAPASPGMATPVLPPVAIDTSSQRDSTGHQRPTITAAATAVLSKYAANPRGFIAVVVAIAGAGLLTGGVWLMRATASPVEAAAAAPVSIAVADPEPVVAEDATPEPLTPAVIDAPDDLVLAIEVRGPVWLRATIDGRTENGRLYAAGDVRRIEGARSVSIRAGDAGAVFVSVNGGQPRALGAAGAAVTRHFGTAEQESLSPQPAADARGGPAVSTDAPGRAELRPSGALPALVPAPVVETARVDAPAPEPVDTEEDTGLLLLPDMNLVTASERWLDAYQRQDSAAMAATSPAAPVVSDERLASERFPSGAPGVQRDLDAVGLEFAGDTAVFTARMTERSATPSSGGEHVSRVSQIWVRRNGRWQLTDVRIISEARLTQLLR
jgi:hypothetical protein